MLRRIANGNLAAMMIFAVSVDLQAAGPDPVKLESSREKAIDFLSVSQADDGSWTSDHAPGITALVAHSLLQSGVKADDAVVEAALKHLESHIKPDGGIYDKDSRHRNYETSISLLAFKSANQNGQYDKVISKAVTFLKKLQWDDEETGGSSHTSFGGAGYGGHERPDLSNTTFFIEALKQAGVSNEDPAMKNALLFVSRCQNLEGKHNTTEFASKIDDGGFYYTPAAGGTSQAGSNPDGGLRSYASMTYAGLKSMIYAGVDKNDPRVKAATTWIRDFYSLEENPGMGQQGLFYYYHTFAKALSMLDIDTFVETDGTKHDWRKELSEHLFEIQKSNGSWVNPEDRWYEGDPNLVTAYALLALKYSEPTEN